MIKSEATFDNSYGFVVQPRACSISKLFYFVFDANTFEHLCS